MNNLNARFWALQDTLMNKGCYDPELFTEIRAIQTEASLLAFNAHYYKTNYELLQAENLRLEVDKAMLEPDREFNWEISQREGQEELVAECKAELGVAI